MDHLLDCPPGDDTLDGKDIEFNGVAPDIRVINTFEDKINGRDPQLDRAIDEILKDLK